MVGALSWQWYVARLTSQFEEFMSVEISISGLKELQAQLDALPTKLAKRVLRPALEDAGAIIQQAAGINAPRESGFLTTHIGLKVVVHNDLSASVKVGPDKSAFWGFSPNLEPPPTRKLARMERHGCIPENLPDRGCVQPWLPVRTGRRKLWWTSSMTG